MSEDHVYTPFPSLSSLRQDAKSSLTTPASRQISGFLTSAKTLILLWARFLGFYTGASEVVFSLDGQPTLVDLQESKWRQVAVNVDLSHNHLATAVTVIGSLKPDDWALLLRYDETTGNAVLSSTYSVPERVLEDLEKGLRSGLRELSDSENNAGLEYSTFDKRSLSVLNPYPKPINGPPFLHQLIDFQSHAEKLAIDYEGPHSRKKQMSYQQVDESSNAISTRIVKTLGYMEGEKEGNVIPLMIPQSPELYLSCLAILKAGFAFCPLNLDAPPERIKLITEDIRAKMILTTQAYKEQLDFISQRVEIVLVDESFNGETGYENNLPILKDPEKLAYVMYTSGSSGTPKGVGISHRAASQALLAHKEHVPQFERFLQFAAPTFDVSVFESFFPLTRGSTLVCCARDEMLGDLPAMMRRQKVDAAELTPTVAGTLLKSRNTVPSLRTLLTIGEMLNRNVVDEFGFSGAEDGILYGMYGPTEATIHCTVAPQFDRGLRVGIIGVPFSTVSAFILSISDETLSASDTAILPQGAIGELALGGCQLAHEYINRPEQTKAAFINLQGYGRVYRTGDKARLNADGLLECLGRMSDGQVKLRGQRVELGEIESVVYKLRGVSHAMSSLRDGTLTLFCLIESDEVTVDEIQSLYRQWLPGFMRPNEVVLLRDAPKLPSGKLDRKAIEQNHMAAQSRSTLLKDMYLNDLERTVAQVAKAELGAYPTRNESLTANGLNSLQAIKIASRLRSRNISVSVADLLSADTVAGIAAARKDTMSVHSSFKNLDLIDTIEGLVQQKSNHLLTSREVDKVLPCSPLQLAMLSETARSASINVNRIEVKFMRDIALIDIKTAFQKFALANDIMRSGFITTAIPQHPFVRVVWRRLQDSQFNFHVPEEARLRKIRSSISLMRPFQVFFEESKSRAVLFIHHALYDQWSWDIFASDLKNILSGQSLVDRPQFEKVAEYFIAYPEDPEYHAAENYWREQLQEVPTASFPCLHYVKSDGQGTASLSRKLSLTVEKLDQLTQTLRVSRPSLISAAYGLLLSAYVGSADVVFGMVTSGRSLPIDGVEQIVGPCISTLPLRVDISSVRSVRDLVALVHRTSRDLLRHGALPLQKIQQLSTNPLPRRMFDTLFVWQESLFKNDMQEPVMMVTESTDYLDFALLLEVEPVANTLMSKVSFQQSVLPEEQAGIFLQQLDQVVAVFSASLEVSLDSVYQKLPEKLLSIEGQVHRNTSQSMADFTVLDGTKTIFNGTAKEVHYERQYSGAWKIFSGEPQRTAIEFVNDFEVGSQRTASDTVTFEQLEIEAVSMACRLVDKGVKQGDLVGILMEKSTALYVSILAVLKSGAGYLPVDPKSPSERICSAFCEATVKCVIAPPSLQAKLKHLSVQHSILDPVLSFRSKKTLKSSPPSSLPSHVDLDCPAYAISTSGTTGIPKTVVISRSNILANLDVLSSTYPFTSRSRYLQSCSQAFDVSVFDILFTFRNGLCLCAATYDVLFRDFEGIIRSLGITHLSMTSSVAAMINPIQVPTVLCLIAAGEVLNPKVLDAWAGRGLFQGYGPSEATNICTLRQNLGANDFPNNIGFALPTSVLFVSSPNDFIPLPRGAAGELCIGGEQVFQGYMNRPELTSQKVITNSRWGRVYRTGDIARVLIDGSFCFLGRLDDQLKLRGQRIELGEIDHAILQISGVKNCATLVVNNQSNGSPMLVSFYTSEENSSERHLESRVSDGLIEKLSPHMVPNDMILIDSIPITETGKVDRKALLERFGTENCTGGSVSSHGDTQSSVEESFSELEESIRDLFSQVTTASLSSVRRNTSLFRFGLDSINSVFLSTNIRKYLSVQVDVSIILKNPSIAQLAHVIRTKRGAGHEAAKILIAQTLTLRNIFDVDFQQLVHRTVALRGMEVSKILPCTPLQETMLSSGNDLRGSLPSSYQNLITFDVFVEEDRLRMAWAMALERHQILRTGFFPTSNARFVFAQVVLENFSLPWQRRHRPLDALDADVVQAANILPQSDFIEPPYSLTFINHNPERSRSQLSFRVHHALYDAEAMSVILNDVQVLAQNQAPNPFTSFDAYIQYMTQLDMNQTDVFWQRHLLDFKPCSLFVSSNDQSSKKSPQNQNSIQQRSTISLKHVEDAAKRLGVTNSCMYQAAWTRFLSAATDSPDVCFGNVYSGRNLPIDGAPAITGPCFNTLPVRVVLQADETNGNLTRKLHNSNLEILPFQPSSLRRIQNRHSGREALFDTLLLVQNDEITLDSHVWQVQSESGNMDFPLILEVMPNHTNDSLTMILHWCTGLFSDSDPRLLLECFNTLLQNIYLYPSSLASTSLELVDKAPQFFSLSSPNRERSSPVKHSLGSTEDTSLGQISWPVEDALARDIISELANVDVSEISPSTTIFGLGLDSINAFQIAAALRKTEYNLSAADLLEAGSIANIGQIMRQTSRKASRLTRFNFHRFQDDYLGQVEDDLGIATGQVEALRPCTPTQCGILSHFIQSRGKLYFNKMSWALQERTDISKLRWAWSEVTKRHEMLRTGFVELEDPKHPFAMITYKAGSQRTPGHGSASVYAPHEQLHVPPWHIGFDRQGSGIVLELTMLHALYDATSLEQILTEAAMLYSGQDVPPVRSILPAIAHFLDQDLEESEEVQAYWKHYGEIFQATKFPNLRPVNVSDTTFASESKVCSPSYSRLIEGCRALNTSLQVAGQCAWARLLSAVVGESKVTFGLLLSGRSIDEIKEGPIVFPCVNTLPLGVDVIGSTKKLLRTLSDRTVSLMKRQNTRLSKVKKYARFEGDMFDTIFVYQKIFTEDVYTRLPWQRIKEEATAEYSISIELIPQENNTLRLQATFRNTLVPREQAQALLNQLHDTLIDSIFCPDRDSRSFSFLGPSSLSHVPAKEGYIQSSIRLLHEFVEQSAKCYPERVALEFATDINDRKIQKLKWTYKELDEEGNRIANLLLQHNISPGSMVGICFDKCPEASFSILGILKAGCAFVPLDPTSPPARKQFILEDTACNIALTTYEKTRELESLFCSDVIAVDHASRLGTLSSKTPLLERSISPDDVCYCLFTSGSTGTPKGCEITHDNVVQAMLAFQRLFKGRWNAHSRWLQFASFHFDVSVLEQYWSWSVGICVTSAPRDILLEDLPGVMRKLRITHVDLTPSLARLVSPEEVPSLCEGIFVTGGEQLRQEILEAWGDLGVIYNGYGPTEATIGCTMLTRVPKISKTSNIGPQFDNVESYVVHPETGEIVPQGAVGELCVSGPLVGRGYHNRVDLTAEKFEHSKRVKKRVYHTGDIVRLLHNGDFDFLTRVDDQVKLRGQRLEIGEINHVLQQSSAKIKELATVVLMHPQQSKEQLVSFVAVNRSTERVEGPTLLAGDVYEDLRQCLHRTAIERLPIYMVPTIFLILDFIPLSANNKVDVKSLKAFYNSLSFENLHGATRYNSSTNLVGSSIFEALLKVFRRFTRVKEISPMSSIFELGIDSISAISFTRALKSEGFEISPAMIMKYPTIESLATFLSNYHSRDSHLSAQHLARQHILAFEQRHLPTVIERLQVKSEDVERISPCTPLQEGIILKTLESTEPLYFSLFVFELRQHINIEQLENSWNAVAQENEILRTQFTLTDDGYAQVVMRTPSALDGSPISKKITASEKNFRAAIEDDHRQWTHRHRDLEGNLWNMWIARRETTDVMCLQIFHALYDGISLSSLLNNVARNYFAMPKRSESPPFHEVLSLGPLCKVEGAKEYWTTQMKHSVLLGLSRSSASHSNSVSISSRFANAKTVRSLRSRLNVTEPAIFLACWLLTLQKHFKCNPTIGLVLSGRTLGVEGAESVTGPMFNTIPARIEPFNSCSISDFIIRCHMFHASSMLYQHTPLRDIVKWLNGRQKSIPFDSLFVFQKEGIEEGISERLCSLEFSNSSTEYPLALEVRQERDGDVSMTLNANATGISYGAASQLASCVEEYFYTAVVNPDFKVSTAAISSLSQSSSTSAIPEDQTRDKDSEPFEWSDEASKIRDEIALLAGLKVESIHGDVSILELGLDSIDAIKLSARLKRVGISLSLGQILRDRTICRMVASISLSPPTASAVELHSYSLHEESHKLKSALKSQGVSIGAFEEVLPATSLQEGIISKMLSSDFDDYYNHDVLELAFDVGLNTLREAWGRVTEANAILRTKFIQVDDTTSPFSFAQAICSPSRLEWEPIPILAKSEIPMVIEHIVSDARKAALEAPMFRLTPVLCGQKCFVIMTAAHAIFDGWSIALIHNDVAQFCAGQRLEDRPPYRTALENILASQASNTSPFWSSQLSGLSPTILSVDKLHSSQIVRQETKSEFRTTKFLSFCRSQGVTPQTIGILCWLTTLAWYAERLDVCFGLVLSGRDTEESEKVAFPMMNTVPFRGVLHGTSSEMLQYIQGLSARMAEAQHYPLRKALRSSKRSSRDLFNTLFIYQRHPISSAEQPQPYRSVGGSSKTQYPINVELEMVDEDVIWRMAYQECIPGDMLLRNIGKVLKYIIEHPDEVMYKISGSSIVISKLPPFKQKDLKAERQHDGPQGPKSDIDDEKVWTEYERAVRSALSAAADVPEHSITKTSSLFHLGLDSISAIKVSTRLKKQLLKLSVADMLKATTVEGMAKSIQVIPVEGQNRDDQQAERLLEQSRSQFLSQGVGIEPAEIERILPATAFQCYALVMCQKSKGRLFNSTFSYKLSRRISPEQLQVAWNSLVQGFPILRTCFVSTEQFEPAFTQVVLRKIESPITWDDARQRSNQGFGTQGPPVRLFAKSETVGLKIKLEMHHALYDAVSLSIIVSSFESLCNQLDLPFYNNLSFESYIREQGAPASKRARRDFWSSYLANAANAVKADIASKSLEIKRLEYIMPSVWEDITGLQGKARQHGLSLQALFIAVLVFVVSNNGPKATSQAMKDVIIGLYLANRSLDLDGISHLAAPTVNIVPLRVRLPENVNSLQLAHQIQSDLREISRMEHCGVTLHEITRWTGVKIDCTLNFLRLPEVADGRSVEGRRITLSRDENSSEETCEVFTGYPSQSVPSSVADAYLVGSFMFTNQAQERSLIRV